MTQKDTLDILKLGHNVFLTGEAGTGKTFILDRYISYLKRKGIVASITASSGIAATHLGGITINSWSGCGVKSSFTLAEIQKLLRRPYLAERLIAAQVLIIDEISMLSKKTFEAVDMILRVAKKSNMPFGGVQVVVAGDFFQLPPVAEEFEKEFVFESPLWKEMNFQICYLDRVIRQTDEEFLSILHQIRSNSITQNSIKTLSGRLYKFLPYENITKLYTHSVDVAKLNSQELAKIHEPEFTYKMKSSGAEFLIGSLKKNCLAEEQLILKQNAFVMFVKNNFEEGYVNGTLGTIITFDAKGLPIVETFGGKLVTVKPAEWTIEEGNLRAKVSQLPLRLAWAMTVHKSQGLSLDAAEIDLGRPFVPGMGYVALSRVRSLSGIRLMGLNKRALEVHPEIIELDKKLQRESKKTLENLRTVDWLAKQNQQIERTRILRSDFRKFKIYRPRQLSLLYGSKF